MFKRPVKEQSKIMKEIDELHEELKLYDKTSEEYADIMKQIELLYKLDKEVQFKIDPNTLLVVGGNILGILIILGYEQAHVVTSKALNFVIKGRV